MMAEGVILRSGLNWKSDYYSKELVIQKAKENGWRIRTASDGEVEAIMKIDFKIEQKNDCISMSSRCETKSGEK